MGSTAEPLKAVEVLAGVWLEVYHGNLGRPMPGFVARFLGVVGPPLANHPQFDLPDWNLDDVVQLCWERRATAGGLDGWIPRELRYLSRGALGMLMDVR